MGVIKEVAYSPHMILSPIFLTRKSSGDGHWYSIYSEFKASKQSHDDREFQNGESPNCSWPSDLVCPNGWVSKVDLTPAYYAVPVAQESKNFLAFHWQVRVYHFLRMPCNGFNQAHREFTKLLKPVAADLRALAFRTWCFYLDDIFLTGSTLTSTTADLEYGRECLMFLRFVFNDKKWSTVPEQRLDILGFLIDSQTMNLSLPDAWRLRLSSLT